MKKKWGWIALAVIVVSALTATFIWNRGVGEPPDKKEAQIPTATRIGSEVLRFPADAPQLTMIQSRRILPTPVPLTDVLSARLSYDDDTTARVGVGFSGRIVALKAAVGDRVKAGQVLAEIDSPDVGTAYADLNKARADEARKRLAFERAKELVPGEAIAAREWEAVEADYAQARAETARAEQRIKNLNPYGLVINGQRVQLASPISGVVSERTATPALEISPALAAPLFVVTDPKRLWLLIDLPEKLVASVKLGSAVSVESDAFPDEQFSAKVVQLGQIVDPNSRRVTIRAVVDNGAQKLLPEMFVRANILQDSGNGVCVPNSAIVNQGIYAFVYIENSPGEFHRRKVSLLTRGGDVSCIGEGLKSGERIVIAGALLLDAEFSARAGDKS